MKLNPWSQAVLLCASMGLATAAMAQLEPDNPDWKESAVPPAPAFSTDKLVPFEVLAGSELTFGIDPATLAVDRTDGVVRYVMVATSRSGAQNIVYEGIRCAKGEVRTYARHNGGKWTDVTGSSNEWRSLYLGASTRPALNFARAGACDNATVVLTPREIVQRMKSNPNRLGN